LSVRNYWLDYAHRLRVTRIVLGISEGEAAAAHGVTLGTYRKWEDGRPPRSCKPYLAFSEKYDVNLDWFSDRPPRIFLGFSAFVGPIWNLKPRMVRPAENREGQKSQ
jgi:hypothetical protein